MSDREFIGQVLLGTLLAIALFASFAPEILSWMARQ